MQGMPCLNMFFFHRSLAFFQLHPKPNILSMKTSLQKLAGSAGPVRVDIATQLGFKGKIVAFLHRY